MICPHCHQEHPESARFCPNSGLEIPRSLQKCPHCYQEIKPGMKLCPFCGGDLVVEQTKPIPVVTAPAPAAPPTLPPTPRHTTNLLWLALVLGILLVGGGIYLVFFSNRGPSAEPMMDVLRTQQAEGVTESQTAIPIISPTEVAEPTRTVPPAPTLEPTVPPLPTDTPEPTATPPNQPLALQINSIDGAEVVLVPAGEFMMGSDPQVDRYFYGAEGPQHMVTLDEFWIYRTEVTNAMYLQCVAVQACPRPANNGSNTRSDYFGNPAFDDYPVVYVSWRHAAAYCVWAGGRLPTEAEWEKAGRGTDGRLFPWGFELPNNQLARYDTSDTVMVGSYPDGASPYGVFDMAGNVHEWVFDYFQAGYYSISPEENPLGPASGSTRVYRGGAYHNIVDAIRVVMRGSRSEDFTSVDIGFRCVIDLP